MNILPVSYLAAAGVMLISLAGCENPGPVQSVEDKQSHTAVPNDNRHVAGSSQGGVVELHLDALQAIWRPEVDAGKPIRILAFAEEGHPAQIPGPFLRVPQGTEVRITVRNSIPDSFPVGLPPENRRWLNGTGFEHPMHLHGFHSASEQEISASSRSKNS